MLSKYHRNESADPAKLNQNRGVGSRHKPRNQKCAIQSKSMPRSSILNVLHHRMDNVQGSDNDSVPVIAPVADAIATLGNTAY